MKRTLLSGLAVLAASVAFTAAPAQAQDVAIADPQVKVACSKPLVDCAFDLAVYAVNYGRAWVTYTGHVVDDVCDIVWGTCNFPTP